MIGVHPSSQHRPIAGTLTRWAMGLACLVTTAGCSRETPEGAASVTVGRNPATTAATTETGMPPSQGPSAPWFTDVVAGSGLSFTHRSGASGRFWLPEMESGGVGLLDIDGDGLLDVFCVDGGSLDPQHPTAPAHRLYRNLGGWRFQDVTASAGLVCPSGFGMGCTVGDYDGDGRDDLYVTQVGSNRLYRNRGDGTFEDTTARAGVAVGLFGTSAAFVDLDQDGDLDLMVVNYVRWSQSAEMECFSDGGRRDYCSPRNYNAPAPTVLFRNRGDGTFEDVTRAAGLDRAYGNGLGVATGDFDHDGRLDLFVANDATPNQLWLNRGGWRFEDDAPLRGCALNSMGIPRAGMGVVAVDLEQRGWLDLFVTHLVGEGNGWFRNREGLFVDAVTRDGPMTGSLPHTGFGVCASDFDHDGHLDLYVANGRVRLGASPPAGTADPYAEVNSLRRGLGGGRFAVVTPEGGTEPPLEATSRGLAAGDLDNDGAPDLVVVNRDGPVHLLRNQAAGDRSWIRFELVGRPGLNPRNAILRLDSEVGVQWRGNHPNEGYCSSGDPRVHFGLGAARSARLQVRWANGSSEDFGVLEARRSHRIEAGRGTAAPGVFTW